MLIQNFFRQLQQYWPTINTKKIYESFYKIQQYTSRQYQLHEASRVFRIFLDCSQINSELINVAIFKNSIIVSGNEYQIIISKTFPSNVDTNTLRLFMNNNKHLVAEMLLNIEEIPICIQDLDKQVVAHLDRQIVIVNPFFEIRAKDFKLTDDKTCMYKQIKLSKSINPKLVNMTRQHLKLNFRYTPSNSVNDFTVLLPENTLLCGLLCKISVIDSLLTISVPLKLVDIDDLVPDQTELVPIKIEYE
jgi:hypothetical protein